MEFASAVPIIAGVSSAVSAGPVITGAAGATVSTVILTELPAALGLPLTSAKAPALTPIVAVAFADAVGVNVAVYVSPDPLNAVILPPVTERSPTARSVVDSLVVIVKVAVAPFFRTAALDRTVTVGTA